MDAEGLSHLDEHGRANMVDVGGKDSTLRVARARARVRMGSDTARAVAAGDGPKGEVLGVARLAGIQAAKQTSALIPLAHNLPLTLVHLSASVDVPAGLVEIQSEVRTMERTGVEMEALVACSVAALTVYDMVKGLEKGIVIEQVLLLEKHGGRSDYVLADAHAEANSAPAGPASRSPSLEPGGAQAQPAPGTPQRPSLQGAGATLITISTSKAAGEGEDLSGAKLVELALGLGAEVLAREVIPDDRALIEERLCHWIAAEGCSLILTSGGTGFSPSDVTPEATRAVLEREAPGIAEAMRSASREHTRHWMLSRGTAGVAGGTLIVNFPGSPASIEQTGEAIAASLPHALRLIAGLRDAH